MLGLAKYSFDFNVTQLQSRNVELGQVRSKHYLLQETMQDRCRDVNIG